MNKSAARKRAIAGMLGPFLVFFAAFFVIPIGYAIYESMITIKRTGALGLGASHQAFAGLSNYAAALSDPAFVRSLGRVLGYACVQVPVMIGLATLLALLLDAASARWVKFFRSAYFLPYGVPGVIASILWGFLYTPGVSPILALLSDVGININMLDSKSILFSIGNIVTWEFAGYNMLVIIAQLKAIDRDLFEAARIDGAGPWQIVWRIKLPLIRPALILTTVFTIIGSLQLFAEPMVLKPLSTAIDANFTPNLAAYNEAFTYNNYSLAAAESVILALVACALSFGFLYLVTRQETKK